VIEIRVPEQELVRRLTEAGVRRVRCERGAGGDGEARCLRCGGELVQRADDNAEVVRERLQVFARDTQPSSSTTAAVRVTAR